ncbi:MAG: ABC transporter permease [Candidatus Komeilibacteria bacterium]
MNRLYSFKIAWQALHKHKVRTALTVLGIVIGIAAVVMVLAAGEGIKGFVNDQISAFGYDIVEIEIKTPNVGKTSTQNATSLARGLSITTLKIDDAKALKNFSYVREVNVGLIDQEVLNYQGNTKTSMVFGTDENFSNLYNMEIGEGIDLTPADNESQARVVVLGSVLKDKLFGIRPALGQLVKIRNKNFKVIGIYKPKGMSFFMDMDSMAVVPIRTLQKQLMGVDHISYMMVKLADKSWVDRAVLDFTEVLRKRHNIIERDPDKYDFSVNTMQEAVSMVNNILGGVTLLLLAIAGISLLVGGVGIMNIMYVSVTERTYEIGLRKAVGARREDILKQFLWEAALITFGGAVVGIILGGLLAYVVALVARSQGLDWPFAMPPQAVLTATAIAIAIGLIFGYYPARRAARLDPIDALRQ